MMELIADLLLGLGALGASIYCWILSRRLRRFNNLQNGMGGAVAVLSAQVDEMTRTLQGAQKAANQSAETLTDLTSRAEDSARKLELMMASLHDLPDPADAQSQPSQNANAEPVVEFSHAATDTQNVLFSSKRTLEAAE